MYNEGFLNKDIAATLKVNVSTVHNYLILAKDISLCDYDAQKHKIRTYNILKRNNTQNLSKPIRCVESGQVFSSSKKCEECSFELFGKKLLSSNIRKVLFGERHHTGGYSFEYISKETFNQMKSSSPKMAFGDYFEKTS